MKTSKIAVMATGILLSIILSGCEPDCPGDPSCFTCTERDQEFGILSESTREGLDLDKDSYLGVFDGGGGGFVPDYERGITEDRENVKEGEASLKATINVGPSGEWAGLFIQYGKTSDPNEVIDMCSFAGGTIKFWIRAEPSVRNLLIGIRSSDHEASAERSKVFLSNYPSFKADNEWHEVTIPIDHLTTDETETLADLSKMKVLFMIASSSNETGGTEGPASFFIDNLRWIQQ